MNTPIMTTNRPQSLPPAGCRSAAIRTALHHVGIPYDMMSQVPATITGLPQFDVVWLTPQRAAVWIESTDTGTQVVIDGLTGNQAKIIKRLGDAARYVAAAARQRLGRLPSSRESLDPARPLQEWLYCRLQWDVVCYPEWGYLGGALRDWAGAAEGTTERRVAWDSLRGILDDLADRARHALPDAPRGAGHVAVFPDVLDGPFQPRDLLAVANAMGLYIHPDHLRDNPAPGVHAAGFPMSPPDPAGMS